MLQNPWLMPPESKKQNNPQLEGPKRTGMRLKDKCPFSGLAVNAEKKSKYILNYVHLLSKHYSAPMLA